MIVVILLGLFAMFFALMEGTGQIKYGLKISFGLIFIFLALRYNYGSDYPEYLNLFRKINQNTGISVFDDYWKVEAGWIILNRLCAPLGFFGMTAILALLNCYIYYSFIKKYVPSKYYWLSIFLYIFNTSFLLIHSTAMRQSVAIGLFIFSLDYLYNKKALRYFLCIATASLFHLSALTLIPLILLGIFNWKMNKKFGIILFSVLLSLFILGKLLLPFINNFISLYFIKFIVYDTVITQTKSGSGLGFLFQIFLFSLTLYYALSQENENSLLFKIALIAFFFIPLTFIMSMIDRIQMYFITIAIAVYPIIFSNIKVTLYKYSILFLLILYTLYDFSLFFESPVWKDSFSTYHTILSSPLFN